jgi:hypothetical protein
LKIRGQRLRRIKVDNNKKGKKNKGVQPSIANDQLGENEIDKDMADKYRGAGNKKKNK